jgi:NAD(P)-dependent dehydrogenase (short-subunit alcohol dehydrogenase family)
MISRLSGKVAIVTGGAQGLGLAIARRFAQEGARIAVVDRNGEGAMVAAAEIGGIALIADLADPQGRNSIVPTVTEKLGPIDILVNCHGICVTEPMMEIQEETWRRTFETNTGSTFFLIQAVAETMIPRRTGSIVNLASNSAFLPKPEQVDYAASKAAIVSLTRSAAAALGPYGIRVNAIAPGVIPTPMTEGIAQARAEIRGSTKEAMFAMFEPLIALKRLGTPEEVASAALFMASNESSYVTGQTLEVCGGLLMR